VAVSLSLHDMADTAAAGMPDPDTKVLWLGGEGSSSAGIGGPRLRRSVAEPGLSRTPGRVLSIDVHKLTVQKIHENINGKIDNIQKAPSRSNIFILFQQLIQVLFQQLIQVQR